MRRSVRRGLLMLATLLLVAAAAYVGWRAGKADAYYFVFAEITEDDDRLPAVTRHLLGREDFHGLYGQDLWLLHQVYPGLTDGYFVDVGSADGEADSNSKLIESVGWRGICVDPFPRNMDRRTCRVAAEVVDSEAGRTVHFQSPGQFWGGILDYAGWWVDKKDAARDAVELTTTTLERILEREGAPPFIHYMSIDIEGAEYEALRTFPFERFRIGALTVEHNDVASRRAELRRLLEANGYRLHRAVRDQDWYVHETLPGGGIAGAGGGGVAAGS